MDLAPHLHFQPTLDSQVARQLLLQGREVVEPRRLDLVLDLLVQARLTRTTVPTATATLNQEVDQMFQTPPARLVAGLLALILALMDRTVQSLSE